MTLSSGVGVSILKHDVGVFRIREGENFLGFFEESVCLIIPERARARIDMALRKYRYVE